MALYYYIALAFIATCHAGPSSKAAYGSPSSFECKSKNGYYAIDGVCDSYIKCHGYKASTESCPDGLYYNKDAKWPDYPCDYTMNVPCTGQRSQPAQATAECPHKYGYFPSPAATAEDCGHYRVCIDGKAQDMECAVGLAFNPASGRCDWADKVASCNAKDFIGFSCPPAPVDEFGEALDIVNYKYPGDCYYFYSCQQGHARVLSCDAGYAFDPALGRCEDEDYVHCEQHKE